MANGPPPDKRRPNGGFDFDESSISQERRPASPPRRDSRTSVPATDPRAPRTAPPPPPQRNSIAGSDPRVPRTATPVPGRTSSVKVPVVQRNSATNLPRTASATSQPKAPVVARNAAHLPPGLETTQPVEVTAVQKRLLTSEFALKEDKFHALTGQRRRDDDDEDTLVPDTRDFDGHTPAAEVTSRDVWKAIEPPVQNREGKRSGKIYRKVIDQFAVGHNPRYAPEGAEGSRAHIFIWDVTRAMNAEVPHFVGAKEMTLAQTVDWLRAEGPMRGWRRVDAATAAQAAQEGCVVLAVAKEFKRKTIAVVRPAPLGADGKPRFASAGPKRGNDLPIAEALEVYAAEYFAHA